jgi:hypothetical protein
LIKLTYGRSIYWYLLDNLKNLHSLFWTDKLG